MHTPTTAAPAAEHEQRQLIGRALEALAPDRHHAAGVRRSLTEISEKVSAEGFRVLVEQVEEASVDIGRRLQAERYSLPAVSRG